MEKVISVVLSSELELEIAKVKKELFDDISDEEMYCLLIKKGLEKNAKEEL